MQARQPAVIFYRGSFEFDTRTLACVSVLHLISFRSLGDSSGADVKDFTYYEKTDSATQAAFLKLQCNCVLCNTTLEFKFEMRGEGEIKEEATCPQCEIRARAKIHSIQ